MPVKAPPDFTGSDGAAFGVFAYFLMVQISLRKSSADQTAGTGYRGLASFLAHSTILSMSLSSMTSS